MRSSTGKRWMPPTIRRSMRMLKFNIAVREWFFRSVDLQIAETAIREVNNIVFIGDEFAFVVGIRFKCRDRACCGVQGNGIRSAIHIQRRAHIIADHHIFHLELHSPKREIVNFGGIRPHWHFADTNIRKFNVFNQPQIGRAHV